MKNLIKSRKSMTQRTLALIISLTIAVLLLVIFISISGPQKLVDLVNNSIGKQSIKDYLP